MKPSEENVVFNNLVSKDVWEVLKADAAKKKANEALYEAVSANDVEKLKAAIAAGADVNESIWGMNALSNAARLGRKLCLQVLIESGADIERRDDRGDTPLVQAIRYWSTPHPKIKTAESSAECAKLLIAAGAETNAAMIEAVRNGGEEALRTLIAAGADEKNPALIEAAKLGKDSCLQVLLESGAEMETRDNRGDSPLMYAVRYWHTPATCCENANSSAACAKILVAAGADLNAHNKRWADYVLSCAAQSGSPECLKFLIQAGADVKKTHDKGLLALKWAVVTGQTECLKLLIDAGAVGYDRTRCAQDMLVSAASRGHTECLKLLIECGARVSLCGALMAAAERGKSECVKLLVDAGVDVNATNGMGETALMYMVDFGCVDAVKSLIDAGADVNAVSSKTGRLIKLKASCPHPQKEEIQDLLSAATLSTKLSAKQKQAAADMLSIVSNNRVDELKTLIESGVDLNAADDNGKNALMCASELGYAECVKLLLSAGAQKKEESLIYAAYNGHADCVSLLLKAGADADARRCINNELSAPLVAATTPEVLKLLLDAGANVNYSAPNPLDAAYYYRKGYKDYSWKIRMLIEAGADVGYYGDYGFALNNHTGRVSYTIPLTKIIESDYDLDVVKLAVDAGADVAPMYGLPPLHAAAACGKLEIADFLIQSGAYVDTYHSKKEFVLEPAVLHMHLPMVEFLISHDVDVSVADEETSLIYALARGVHHHDNSDSSVDSNCIPLLKLLIAAGANVNREGRGEAPLACLIRGFGNLMSEVYISGHTKKEHAARVDVYKKSVQMLLKAKADVNVFSSPDYGGLTALMEAVKVGVPEVVEMLLLAGADVNAKTEDGKSVFRIKTDYQAPLKKEITRLLKSAQSGTLTATKPANKKTVTKKTLSTKMTATSKVTRSAKKKAE